jgi:outer membrane protein assembly factor BamD (BamD/ComL family)
VIAAGPAGSEWVGESQWHLVQLNAGPKDNWKEAIALCEVLAKTVPKERKLHEQAMFARAWIYWSKNDWAKARVAFQDLIAAYPEKASHPPIMEYLAQCSAQGKTP